MRAAFMAVSAPLARDMAHVGRARLECFLLAAALTLLGTPLTRGARMQFSGQGDVGDDTDAESLDEAEAGEAGEASEATRPFVGQVFGSGRFRLISELHAYPLPQDEADSMLEAASDVVPASEFHSEQFSLGVRLGNGNVGTTYLAERTECAKTTCTPENRTVALKFIYQMQRGKEMLSTANDKDPRLRKEITRMIHECGVLQGLQVRKQEDPNGASKLVNCLEACCPTCRPCQTGPSEPEYIVMEYAGEDGFDWVARSMTNTAAIADILTQVAEAIDYMAHLKPPIIHHDLKWENLAITEEKKAGNVLQRWVKVIDFGSALPVNAPWSKELSVVTREYEPPESIMGYAYKLPAYAYDVYSLGVMAIEDLCGYRDNKNLAALKENILKEHNHNAKSNTYLKWADTLGLKPQKANCVRSTAILLHPDPAHRPEPYRITFAADGTHVAAKLVRRASGNVSLKAKGKAPTAPRRSTSSAVPF